MMTEFAEPATAATQEPTRFADRKSAEMLCARITAIMDDLNAVLVAETDLIRASKLLEAAELQSRKSELAAIYVSDMNEARNNALVLGRLAPEAVTALHQRHEEFRSLLQINMAVLATAREVSEDIMKSVAEAVGARETVSGYGQSGLTRPKTERTASGIAYDRSL